MDHDPNETIPVPPRWAAPALKFEFLYASCKRALHRLVLGALKTLYATRSPELLHGIELEPDVPFGGRLTEEQYDARKRRCTDDQLAR